MRRHVYLNPFVGVVLATALGNVPEANAQGGKPTQADIDAAMKKIWSQPAGPASPQTSVVINSVKFGPSRAVTLQDRRDRPGLPANGTITEILIDFSVKRHEPKQTYVTRRVREAIVYRDQFDEWHVDSGRVVGKDVDSVEPAIPQP